MSPVVPSMADRDGKIWMDGQMVDWRDAKIHVLSHTLHYGCGAFEGVRAYKTAEGTAIFRLEEHTERLFNSAKILRMKIPFTKEEVNEAQKAVVRENRLESCYLRPLTWIGSQKLGVSPKGNQIHLMIAAWAWGAYLGEEGMQRGIRVKTSSYTRHHVNITMTQAKASATTRIPSSPTWKPWTMATTRRCCSTAPASCPKARARTFSSSRMASSIRPICRPVRSTASRAIPFCTSPRIWGVELVQKTHHARRGVHLRRGVLHGNGGGSHANSGTRPH